MAPPPAHAASSAAVSGATATVASSALAAATRATPEIKTQDLQQAVDFYQKGTEVAHNAASADDYVRAIELYSLAIAIRDDQPRFFFARGNAFRAITELEFAAKDYSLAIALDDRTAAYFANRGACYRKLNQPTKALEDLTAAVDMDSKKASHCFNRALVLYDHAFFKEATVDLTRTLEEGSAGIRIEYKALQMRGTCYRKLGNLQRCIDDLQHAIQLDGRNSTGFSSLAQAYLDAGDLDHAIEHFSNAIQFNASQASYFSLRGLCYYRKCHGEGPNEHSSGTEQQQNSRLSLADFNQSIRLDGKDPQAYFYRGSIRLALALDMMRDGRSAIGHARPLVATPGDSVSIGGSSGPPAGTALTAEEQLEAAFADIEMAWTLSPKGIKFQVGMGMISQLKKQYSEARALFSDVSASNKMNVVVKYHWALCCRLLDDTETALALLCDCVGALPDEPLFFEARGLALQEAGHHALAIEDLSDAIELRSDLEKSGGDPNTSQLRSAWDLYVRAESHVRLEHFELAIEDATRALTLVQCMPATPPAQTQLLEVSARNVRGMAHRGLGNYEYAIDDLTACLKRSPTNDVFLYHRALCLVESERFLEALPDLHGALVSNASDACLLYYAGLCYYHSQQSLECIEFMERARVAVAVSSDKEQPAFLVDLHYRTGVAHARQGRNIAAIEHFTTAIDLAEASPDTCTADVARFVHERAKALQLERYYEESIEDFTFVVRHNPNNAHAYFRRGFALKALGRLQAAAADLESAKLLDPKNPLLVVKYKEIRDTECVELCMPGEEPVF